MKLLKEVLEEIKPDNEDKKEVFSRVDAFLDKVNKGFKDGKAVLGGSGDKGTWLKNVHDADIFVQFDYKKFKDKSEKLSDILEKHLKKKFKKVIRLHGSRDYFQIKEKDFLFEVIPVLKINKALQAKNITDVSLLHAKWVKKHKKYVDDIRLVKQFCKANNVYGAESYIKGFSGYICEILTIHYKGFLGLVKNGAKWEEKTIIDTEKYYKNKNEVLFNLNNSKLTGPLVIIDPVQKDRNAAAAISLEKFNEFVKVCKKFLRNPSYKFFEIKELSEDDIKKKGKVVLIDVVALGGKDDVVGSKLLKSFEFIKKSLWEFNVKESGWDWNRFWFALEKDKLSDFVVKEGPFLKMEEHVKKFKKKYKKTFTKNKRVYAKEKRKIRDLDKFVKDLIKNKYLKDKVKKLSLI